MNRYIFIFLGIVCFSLSILFQMNELFTDYVNNSVYLKNNTNTTYDNYIDRKVLNNNDSASLYMMNHPPESIYDKVDNNINDRMHLIDYFIDIYKP